MPGGGRKRHAAAVVVLATTITIVLGIAFAPAAGARGDRGKLLRLINAARERHDLRELRMDRSLSRDALRHTRRMVKQNRVFDPPNLDTFLNDEPWERIGASVSGCADTLGGLHHAWMRHTAHRVIMLEPRLRRIGIGIIRDRTRNICGRGSFWGTELFYG
ncbi:MAG TPA: CAP domain-containing protein [Actinomycetota bacterium]|nr:CAP domain-containing protein [Actinomycetota bacterium]